MLFFKSRKGVKITCKRKWGTRLGGFGMELDYAALGERIRQRRQEKGLTQSYVAEQAGIEPSNISHIERAASKVGLNTLVKIANILECTVNDLLCDSLECERHAFENQLLDLSKDCSPKELRVITDLALALKDSLRKRDMT